MRVAVSQTRTGDAAAGTATRRAGDGGGRAAVLQPHGRRPRRPTATGIWSAVGPTPRRPWHGSQHSRDAVPRGRQPLARALRPYRNPVAASPRPANRSRRWPGSPTYIAAWHRAGDWANQWLSLRHVFGICCLHRCRRARRDHPRRRSSAPTRSTRSRSSRHRPWNSQPPSMTYATGSAIVPRHWNSKGATAAPQPSSTGSSTACGPSPCTPSHREQRPSRDDALFRDDELSVLPVAVSVRRSRRPLCSSVVPRREPHPCLVRSRSGMYRKSPSSSEVLRQYRL